MSKKIILGILILSIFNSGIIGARDVLVEGKIGGYFPAANCFKKIYGAGLIYGAEVTFDLCNCLYGWTSIDVFPKKGKSVGLCNKTRMLLLPIGLGLKYFWDLNFGNVYLGGGLLINYLHTKDCSPFVVQNESKWGVGAIGKFGLIFDFCDNYFADVFFDYSYIRFGRNKCSRCVVYQTKANTSGFSVGLGLGYRFD